MNQTIYVLVDGQNYVSDFKLQPADDYTKLTVPLSWIADFMKYPTKFSVVDGILKSPGNLPSVSNDELKKQLDDALEKVETQQQKLDSQETTITQLQTIAGQLTAQVAFGNSATTTSETGAE